MSELTRCNFCSLKDVRAWHKKEGNSVFIVPCKKWGGFDLIVIKKGHRPRNVEHGVSYLNSNGNKDTRCIAENSVYPQSSWMMKIGISCDC